MTSDDAAYVEITRLKEELLHLYYTSVESLDTENLQNVYYPYFSWQQRRTYFLVPESLLCTRLIPGDCLHFPFLEAEKTICLEYLIELNLKLQDMMLEEHLGVCEDMETMLLGRHHTDIRNWLVDLYHEKSHEWYGDKIILYKDKKKGEKNTGDSSSKGTFTLLRLLQERKIEPSNRFHDLKDLLGQKEENPNIYFRHVMQARMNSGPFTSLKKFQNGLGFVSSSTAFIEPHLNREGEVTVCRLAPKYQFISWDAHTTILGEEYGNSAGSKQHHTVTDVQICQLTDHFFTASWDHSIKVWRQSDLAHCNTWKGHKDHVLNIALHSSELILASTGQDGSVMMWPFDFTHAHRYGNDPNPSFHYAKDYKSKPSTLFRKPQGSFVEHVNFLNGRHSDVLACLTCYDPLKRRGAVEFFDGVQMKSLAEINDIIYSITSISSSTQGELIAAGTGIYKEGLSGDGILRVYEMNQLKAAKPIGELSSSSCRPIYTTSRPCETFVTNHYNVDSVSFSPDDLYVLSADLTTNEIVIFDRRFSSKAPLYTMSHSDYESIIQNNDAYVAIAWLSPSLLLTGGEDSFVRLWNLTTDNSSTLHPSAGMRTNQYNNSPLLVQEWELDHPVNAICLSHDAITFAAGTEIGGLHLFSLDASLVANGPNFTFQFAKSS